MAERTFHELALDFRYLNDFLQEGGSATTARQRLVDLASSVVPECKWAGITLRPPDARSRTLTYSGDTALQLDELQYEIGDGPCLEAALSSEPVRSVDLTNETRWPAFCAAALRQSRVRGVMSFHVTDQPAPTALNLYTTEPGAFDDNAVTFGAVFATHAAVLMAHADSSHRAAALGAALTTSRQIGAAIGILMSAHKITETEAFELLRRASSHLNRKLHTVARDVTDTGQLPGRAK